MNTIKRGDVFFCLGSPEAVGSEERKTRPVVIVQNDAGNASSPTVIVANMTTNTTRRLYPMQFDVDLPGRALSRVQCEQIRTVDKSRLRDKVYSLTEDELRRMMTTRLRHKRQDYNRDMFLFSCFTGICYADMSALTYEQLEQDTNGDWWISGNRQKTETKYVVKLLPYPLFLLDKYRGLAGNRYLFKLSSLDSIDDSLKNIARECGIDKQLSFHLARHTYATTICLSNGVSLETLSKMLGHKNITTTQIYARVTHPMIDREVDMLKEKLADKFAVV